VEKGTVEQDNGDGVVLLIGSGRRAYREYLIAGLAELAPVWLIDEDPVSWQEPYLAGSSVVGMLDSARAVPDEAALVDAAAEVGKERAVAGVCTYDEGMVIATAVVAERLGLPGLTVAGARHCRDKHLTRTALTAAGLRQPRFALVNTPAQAAAAAERIGFPVVLKPRGMGASAGVVRIGGPGEVAGAFEITARAGHAGPPDFEQGLLVEEMIDGPEISVDGAVFGGEYEPFCLARKHSGPPPCFEEVGHIVDGRDPLGEDLGLRLMLARAHRVLGLDAGITHTEIRLSAAGPVIIEVNGRLGGDLIPYLGKLATGVDPGQVAADVARGTPPSLTPAHRDVAGVRFLYPPQDCRIGGMSLPRPDMVPGLFSAEPLAATGAAVYLPPRAHLGRYAALIALTSDVASCQAALDQAAALASVTAEPLRPSELEPEHLL
jgi:biotin carboxylase